MPTDFAGYERCLDCSTLILTSLARQTHGRCLQCWKDRHPLATLEVVNASVRRSAKAMVRHTRAKGVAPTGPDPLSRKARQFAHRRLSEIFPDLYAMLLDEERTRLGLSPIARYEANDFEKTASETLGFEDVYDALESSGATDA